MLASMRFGWDRTTCCFLMVCIPTQSRVNAVVTSEIVFQNTTYNIAQVMNVTGLENVKIEVHGTLIWSKDIDY